MGKWTIFDAFSYDNLVKYFIVLENLPFFLLLQAFQTLLPAL